MATASPSLPTPAPAPRDSWWQRNRRYILLPLVVGAALSAHQAIEDWRDTHALMINASESLPNFAFFVERNKNPTKFDIVFFDPPKTPLVVKHFGREHGPFGKYVTGVPGDVVTHEGNSVYVNDLKVAEMKPLTKKGERLHPGPTGVIPEGCYFVTTPHRDGFDSRYAEIGLACRKQILGTGKAIL